MSDAPAMHGRMHRFAASLVAWRTPLLVVGLLATFGLMPLAGKVVSDRSVKALFPPDSSRLRAYRSVTDDFGGDAVCLMCYRDPDLFSAAGFRRLAALRERVERVPGVLSVSALDRQPVPGDSTWLTGAVQRLLAGGSADGTLWTTLAERMADPAADAAAIRRAVVDTEMYRDLLVGADGRTAALVLLVDRDAMADGTFAGTLNRLRAIAAAAERPTVVVGTPVMISDVYSSIDKDSVVLRWASLAAMLAVIGVLFRNLRWAVLPFLIVTAALTWTRCVMVLTGAQLSIVGSMTTSLVTVIGIATSIHIAVRYREEREGGAGSDHDVLVAALAKVLPPVFWSCATTAAGFAALAVSDVAPIRGFASVMAASALFVGLATVLLVPGGVLVGRFGSTPGHAPGETGLGVGLDWIVRFVGRHSFATAAAVLASLAVAGIGFRYLEAQTDFTKNFRADSSIVQGYRFVERNLGGAALVEVSFDCPGTLTPEYLKQVGDCERRLREIPGVTKVTGLSDLIDFLDRTAPLGDTPLLRLLGPQRLLDLKLRVMRTFKGEALAKVYNPDRDRMLLQLRVRERPTIAGKKAMVADIEATVRAALPRSREVVVTGLYVLLIHLIDSLLGDQWLTFAVSAVAIWTLATVALRSPRLGLVAFLPNLVPIVLTVGVMGWLGLRINVATAMIGSISMGLVIDFSIHYLFRFRQEGGVQDGGADFYAALARTHGSTGKAMVFANLALMVGFLLLTLSAFVPTVHFGLLVSVAILGGLLGNLLLLPVLLRLAFGVPAPAMETRR